MNAATSTLLEIYTDLVTQERAAQRDTTPERRNAISDKLIELLGRAEGKRVAFVTIKTSKWVLYVSKVIECQGKYYAVSMSALRMWEVQKTGRLTYRTL